MKKALMALALLVSLVASVAHADYHGSSGTRYEYDLSRPGDALSYEIDPSAQLRDDLNSYRPGVELDRGLGQYGGGILD